MLVERHGGQVPESFEALEALPGVGHKTASVVMAQAREPRGATASAPHCPVPPRAALIRMPVATTLLPGQAFGHEAFPVDTHIHRLAQRWGLTPAGKSVEQTEADLKAVFPPHLWNALHLQVRRGVHGAGMRHAGSKPCAVSNAAIPPFPCSVQIIFFGREMCPAKGHNPSTCPICCWAAVPPFDRPGSSPSKANGKLAKSQKRSAAAVAGGGSSSDAEREAATPKRRGRPKKTAAGGA